MSKAQAQPYQTDTAKHELNPQLAQHFFDVLYSRYLKESPRPVYIEVRGKRESDSDLTFKRFYMSVDLLIKDMGKWPADSHYWFGVALRWNDQRGRKQDCTVITVIFTDLDYGEVGHKKKNRWQTREEALAAIEAFPIPPSIIIHTGFGFHLYWLLIEPFGLDNGNYAQVEAIVKGITIALGGDVGTQDISHVLRIPGTFNVKLAGNPRPVEMVHCEPRRVYALDDFSYYQKTQAAHDKRARVPPGGPQTTDLEALNIPKWAKGLILSGDSSGYGNDRSARDFAVVKELIKAGVDFDAVEKIYQMHPVGVDLEAGKYLAKGRYGKQYLRVTFDNVLKALAEAQAKSKSQATPGAEIDRGLRLTDWGNAERLVALHGGDLRFCDPLGKWLTWDGRRWTADATLEVERRAKDMVRSIYSEAAAAQDQKLREALAHHALKSESEAKRKALIASARSEPGIPILPEHLDRDPWLLNVLNGTIDLRTGQLRPHSRGDFITKLAPVHFDPKAECPLWWKFLERILPPEIVEFVQKAVGYSATGLTREQVFFLLYGLGDNGKTVFLETIGGVLGDYAKATDPETFMLKKYSGIPNDLAALRGARFVKSVETSGGRRMSEARIKQMTGEDTVTARFLHAEWFDFKPQFKWWLATNNKPIIRDPTHSMWRRVRFIPFEVQIPKEEQDKQLSEKLKEEWPGILNLFIVEGALLWQHKGLEPPERIKQATQAYREEMDILGMWIGESCVVAPGASALATELHKSYLAWAEQNGEKQPLSQTAFGTSLTERGYPPDRRGDGKVIRLGIGLKAGGFE